MGGISPGTRVRSANDGQIGFVCEMEDSGRLGVRLDRRGESRVVPFEPAQWREDSEPELTPMQLARVIYGIDRELRIARGAYSNVIPEWISVAESQRRAWLDRAKWKPVLEALRAVLGL